MAPGKAEGPARGASQREAGGPISVTPYLGERYHESEHLVFQGKPLMDKRQWILSYSALKANIVFLLTNLSSFGMKYDDGIDNDY